jgi:hypothetical protein
MAPVWTQMPVGGAAEGVAMGEGGFEFVLEGTDEGDSDGDAIAFVGEGAPLGAAREGVDVNTGDEKLGEGPVATHPVNETAAAIASPRDNLIRVEIARRPRTSATGVARYAAPSSSFPSRYAPGPSPTDSPMDHSATWDQLRRMPEFVTSQTPSSPHRHSG